MLCLLYFTTNAQQEVKDEEVDNDSPQELNEREFELTKDPALGYPPSERLQIVRDYVDQLQQQTSLICGLNWEERGPNNVGGRTRAIMFDPNVSNQVWAGGVDGGLWKCDNITSSGYNWSRKSDFWENLAISSIAYDPTATSTFYVGTGEGWYNSDYVVGYGIWKSIDGGQTWNHLATTSAYTFIQKIVVEPGTGYVYAATKYNGLLRSINGGVNWATVLPGSIADIEIDANGDFYASVGINNMGGVYRSLDGITWNQISNGFPISNYGRIDLACAPSDPTIAYAMVQQLSTGNLLGIYKYSTSSAMWTQCANPNWHDDDPSCTVLTSSNICNSQAWYDLAINVDPNNANTVFVGGINLFKTTNAGTSWTQISDHISGCLNLVHADQHVALFKPGSSSEIVFGNDGGIYYSSTATSTFPNIVDRNTGYNITQFYSCAMNPVSGSDNFLGGTQDNGTQKFVGPIPTPTVQVTGGDGGLCFIDQTSATEASTQVSSYIRANYWRTLTNWVPPFGTAPPNYHVDNTCLSYFINAGDYDSRENTLYFPSGDGPHPCVGTISKISNVTSAGAGVSKYIDVLWPPPYGYSSLGNISLIKVSPYANPGMSNLFVGTIAGQIFRIADIQANSNSPSGIAYDISIQSMLPFSPTVSCIEIGASENQLLVTFSNYGVNSVWETLDGGLTWTNKEGNLLDMPVRWALYNPNNRREVLLATEAGVWSTDDIEAGAVNWTTDPASGISRVRVDMLKTRSSDDVVVAATHGRGLFSCDCVFGHPVASFSAECQGSLAIQFHDLSSNATGWTWVFGDGNTSLIQNPSHQFSGTGPYTVSLTVTSTACPGCPSTFTIQITVPSSASPIVSVSVIPAGGTICSGQSATLTASGALTYTWDPAIGLNSITGSPVIASPTATTSYVVTGTDNNGCSAQSSPTTITVTPPYSVSITGSTAACDGQSVTLSVPNIYTSYLWSNGETTSSITATVSNQYSQTTTFSIVVTDASGCVGSGSITITVFSAPIVNVTGNPSLTICPGASTTLTATGANTYVWSTGALTPAITVSPGATSNYTVTGTYGSFPNCSTTVQVTVTVNPLPNIAITNPSGSNCTGTQLCATAGYPNYSWSPGGETTQCINATSAVSYSVIVTDAAGCSGSGNYNFTGMNLNCCGTGTEYLSTTGSVTGGQWHINSNLFISTSCTLTNADFSIADGVYILVQNGAVLTINGCHFYACHDQWIGFSMQLGCRIDMSGSTLKDAQEGISLGNGNNGTITGNIFDHNDIDIHAYNYTFPSTTIAGNTFTYSSLAAFDPKLPTYHILIESQATITIGRLTNGLTDRNSFEKKMYGIYAALSNVTSYNNKFVDIGRDETDEPGITIRVGSAIYSTSKMLFNHTLNVNDGGVFLPNKFLNCVVGVTTLSLKNIFVNQNEQDMGPNHNNGGFENCHSGVIMNNFQNANADIHNNDFVGFSTDGIGANGLEASAILGISKNWFNCLTVGGLHLPMTYDPTPGRYSVSAINVQANRLTTVFCTIKENIISNSAVGIHLRNLDAMNAGDVQIGDPLLASGSYSNRVSYLNIPRPILSFTSPYITIGYWIERCNKIRINNSKVSSNITPVQGEERYFHGFSLDNSTSAILCENEAEKVGSGFRTYNLCTGSEYHGNTTKSNFWGFNLLNASLPFQGSSSNAWGNYWNRLPANFNDIMGSAGINLNWYHQTGIPPNDPYNPNIFAFNVLPGISTTLLTDCIHPPAPRDEERDNMFGTAVDDATEYENFPEENEYQDKENFYKSATTDPTLLSIGVEEDEIYVDAYNTLSTTNIGAFTDVEESFKQGDLENANSLINKDIK